MSNYFTNYNELYSDYLSHHGILGQKWGIRRFQNSDGSLTAAGRARYSSGKDNSLSDNGISSLHKAYFKASNAAGYMVDYGPNKYTENEPADPERYEKARKDLEAAKSLINELESMNGNSDPISLSKGGSQTVRIRDQKKVKLNVSGSKDPVTTRKIEKVVNDYNPTKDMDDYIDYLYKTRPSQMGGSKYREANQCLAKSAMTLKQIDVDTNTKQTTSILDASAYFGGGRVHITRDFDGNIISIKDNTRR